MDCTEFLERYSDYDDSLVPPPELERFRAHLAGCETCARYDRVLRKGRMLARQAARVEASSDFVPRLRLRLLTERHRELHPGAGSSRLASALASVTVVLAISATLSVIRPDSVPAPVTLSAAGGAAVTRLPAALPTRELPRGWTASRVDPGPAASYSPVVTGPPAYGRASPGPAVPATPNPTPD